MPLLIQTAADPYYEQRVRLDETDYLLKFAWNQRESRWSVSFYTDRDEPILTGLKLLANWPLFESYRYIDGLPRGELIACDWTGDGTPPLLGELGEGKRCQLIYFSAEELKELEELEGQEQ